MSTIQTINRSRIFMNFIISMLLVFSLLTPQWTHAATLVVDTLLDENDSSCSDGDCSLRDAIQLAAAGDIITFSVTGTIVLSLGQLTVEKDLTISGPGQENLIVSGNSSSRVFYATGGTVNISDLTIANGSADNGGGMYNYDGTSIMENITFSGNTANYSGGLFNYGSCMLTNVTFSSNSAYNGGGMYNYGTSILTNVIFNSNSSFNYGGGMISYGTSTLTNVTFSHNSATEYGGGMFNSGTSTLTNVTFSDNSAVYSGGMYNYGTSILENVTFSGNSAVYSGGMYNYYGTATLTNVTFNGNSASGFGGGVYVGDDSTLILKNTILAINTAPKSPDCYGILISYGYNLIQNTTGCTISGDEKGNIYGKDPLLGPLADNGGYTLTYALLPGSPAIDAADFTDPYGNPVTEDQRGVSRPQGPVNDIGAFELVYQVHWFWLPFVLK